MELLKNFPSRVEGWLQVWDVDKEEIQFSEWKYQKGQIPPPNWQSMFCVVMENDAVMHLFKDEYEASLIPSPAHIPRTRLDSGGALGIPPELEKSFGDLANDSTLGSSADDSWRRGSRHCTGTSDSSSMDGVGSSLPPPGPMSTATQSTNNSSQSSNKIMGFFRSGLMSRTKSATKLDPAVKKEASQEPEPSRHQHMSRQQQHQSTTSSSSSTATSTGSGSGGRSTFNLKRSFSLGRISRNRRSASKERTGSPPPTPVGPPPPIPSGSFPSPAASVRNLPPAPPQQQQGGGVRMGRASYHMPTHQGYRPIDNGSPAMGQPRALSSENLSPPGFRHGSDANGGSLRGSTLSRLPLDNAICTNGNSGGNGGLPPSGRGWNWPINGGTYIRPLNASLLAGRRHGFAVTSAGNHVESGRTCFFAVKGEAESQRWMRCLRRTAKPNLENERHHENSLKLCVQEAKNLPSKRRYFCDVCLDRTLYARTTSKPVSDAVFWGEEFDLNNLPDVSVITLNLYREADPSKDGKKKKKKNQNQLISYVTILVSEISKRNETQCWLTMQPPGGSGNDGPMIGPDKTSSLTNGSSGANSGSSIPTNKARPPSDLPQIRVRMRFQCVDILPIRCYQPLNILVSTTYAELVTLLEGLVGVRVKEDLAGSLVNVHEKAGTAHTFLTDLVLQEIITLDNDSLVLRSNTFASKAMECYLKLVGGKYMQEMLQDFVHTILTSSEDCEVDPAKLTQPGQLQRNQATLVSYASAMLNRIFQSEAYFPSELRLVFSTLRSAVQPSKGSDLCDRLISGCLFLRLICPAVLSPCLFGLAQEFPESERIARNLTLLAKTLQTLANCSLFEDKELYMCFLNSSLLEREVTRMSGFLSAISTYPPIASNISSLDKRHSKQQMQQQQQLVATVHDYIDLGYEFALLHLQISEAIAQIPKDNSGQLVTKLRAILNEITATMENFMPPVRRGNVTTPTHSVLSSSSSQQTLPPSAPPSHHRQASTASNSSLIIPPSPLLPHHSTEDLTTYLSQHSRPQDSLIPSSEDYAVHPFPSSSPYVNHPLPGNNTEFTAVSQQQTRQQQLMVSRKTLSLDTTNQRRTSESSMSELASEQSLNDSWNRLVAHANLSTNSPETTGAAPLPLNMPARLHYASHTAHLEDPFDQPSYDEDDRETLYDAVAPSTHDDGPPSASPNYNNQPVRFFNPLYGLYPVRPPSQTPSCSSSLSPPANVPPPPPPPDIAFITAGIAPPPPEEDHPAPQEPQQTPVVPGKSKVVRRRSSSQGRLGAAGELTPVSRATVRAKGEPARQGVIQESPGRSRRNSGGSRHASKGDKSSKKSSKEYETEIGELSRQLGDTLARLNSMEELLDQREREKQNLEQLVRLVTAPANTLHDALNDASGGEGVASLLTRLRSVDQNVCSQKKQMGALISDGNRFIQQRQMRLMELEAAGAGLQACLDDVAVPPTVPPSGDTYC